jgi:hypothetical protein
LLHVKIFSNKKREGNYEGGALLAQKDSFSAILGVIFYCSTAEDRKNPLCLVKNGHFFVSEAITKVSYKCSNGHTNIGH